MPKSWNYFYYSMVWLSVIVALFLLKSGLLHSWLLLDEGGIKSSFIAGGMYASMVSSSLSLAIFYDLGNRMPVWQVAVLGGAGAAIGDLLLFTLVAKGTHHKGWLHRFALKLGKHPMIKLGLVLAGVGLIISPLPDEAGVALLGAVGLERKWFMPLGFVANAVGIGLVASAGAGRLFN